MPRINVEDEWFDDPRREALIGRVGIVADAVAIRMWRLAQTYYRNKKFVPVPLFEAIPHWQEFEAVGLAVRQGDFVYVRGQSAHFAWLDQRKAAGKIGGEKSGKARREKIDKKTKLIEAKGTKLKQIEPSPSSSSSVSNTNTEDSATRRGDELALAPAGEGLPPVKSKFDPGTNAKMAAFIATYARAYRAKYGGPPEKLREPAIVGKIGHWIKHISQERACQLAEVFLQVDYRPINESCHDPWLFFRHLNRIGNALSTGQDPGTIDWARVFKT